MEPDIHLCLPRHGVPRPHLAEVEGGGGRVPHPSWDRRGLSARPAGRDAGPIVFLSEALIALPLLSLNAPPPEGSPPLPGEGGAW